MHSISEEWAKTVRVWRKCDYARLMASSDVVNSKDITNKRCTLSWHSGKLPFPVRLPTSVLPTDVQVFFYDTLPVAPLKGSPNKLSGVCGNEDKAENALVTCTQEANLLSPPNLHEGILATRRDTLAVRTPIDAVHLVCVALRRAQ